MAARTAPSPRSERPRRFLLPRVVWRPIAGRMCRTCARPHREGSLRRNAPEWMLARQQLLINHRQAVLIATACDQPLGTLRGGVAELRFTTRHSRGNPQKLGDADLIKEDLIAGEQYARGIQLQVMQAML